MKRIRTKNGFFRDIRPPAGLVTYAMMYLLSFLGGASGLLLAVIYCAPIPVTLLAFVGLGKAMLSVLSAILLVGGGVAMGLLTALIIEDVREKRRQRAERAARILATPGPWGRCILRHDREREAITRAREMAIVPRRWR